MMFSSNQILEVSGNLSDQNELEIALEFALKYSGYAKNMKQDEIDRGCKLLYQITEDGKYCIGWGFEKNPEGWIEYPFRFDIDIECGIRNFGPRVEHDEHHIVAGGPCIDEGVGVLTLG